MSRSKNRWPSHKGPPPFGIGDAITPCGEYSYDNAQHKWPSGEYRAVVSVGLDDNGYNYVLGVYNPVSHRISYYTPTNFKKADTIMYEAAKYFAVKLQSQNTPIEHGLLLQSGGVMTADTSPLYGNVLQVQQFVEKQLQEGDRWLVVKTVALLEAEPPRPPMKRTDYK